MKEHLCCLRCSNRELRPHTLAFNTKTQCVAVTLDGDVENTDDFKDDAPVGQIVLTLFCDNCDCMMMLIARPEASGFLVEVVGIADDDELTQVG